MLSSGYQVIQKTGCLKQGKVRAWGISSSGCQNKLFWVGLVSGQRKMLKMEIFLENPECYVTAKRDGKPLKHKTAMYKLSIHARLVLQKKVTKGGAFEIQIKNFKHISCFF